MGLQWEGLDSLNAKIGKEIKASPEQMGKALALEAELIMTTAKQRTPVDIGTLHASGFVRRPHVRLGSASVTMGFGGAAEPYALVQHERTDYHHETGQAKFLESAVNDAVRGFVKRMRGHLRMFK